MDHWKWPGRALLAACDIAVLLRQSSRRIADPPLAGEPVMLVQFGWTALWEWAIERAFAGGAAFSMRNAPSLRADGLGSPPRCHVRWAVRADRKLTRFERRLMRRSSPEW